MRKHSLKAICFFLLTFVLFISSSAVSFASTEGHTSCPKTVRAGQFFSYSLTCPTEYPDYDQAYVDARGPRVFKCIQCEKWFYQNELVEGVESINGLRVLVCPECNEGQASVGVILPDGRTVKNVYGASLGYGSVGCSWGCTNRITTTYQSTIPLEYGVSNSGDYIQIKKPGTYYLTAAYGVNEDCDYTTQSIDLNTRQIVDTGKVQYKKVRCVQYTHNTITVLGKVKFNANKGKVKSSTRWIAQKSKVGKLPKPTRKGYKFKGWYTKKKGGKKINKTTTITFKGDSITFYARWKKK